eukprot:1947362-Ditylum_brightwellii.AAC.1
MISDSKEDRVDDSVAGDDKHLTHLTQEVSCCLKRRSEQTTCVDDSKEDGVDDSVAGSDKYLKISQNWFILRATSEQNACVDNSKVDGADDSVAG